MNKTSSFLLTVLAYLMLVSCSPRDRYVVIAGFAQGGTYSVKFNLKGEDGMVEKNVEEIRDSIDAILSRIDNSISGYNRKSLLSRFNSGQEVVPDRIFIDVFKKGYDLYNETGGVVDVASAPLFDIWGFGFTRDSLPDASSLDLALAASGMDRMKHDIGSVIGNEGTISPSSLLLKDGPLPKLNYNAIAQGYSCDLVASYLYSIGVKDMLVDIGEIFCDGMNPSGQPWTLGIDRPVDGNDERGADLQAIFKSPGGPCGIVTSGNYRKYYVKDGRKYSHSIDPRTGYPVSHSLLSATIVAQDALTADAYATYCMVVGLHEAQLFIEETPGFEGCLIYDEDGQMKTWTSSGFILSPMD
ncbi:MAG: FAD:protein FMN transferase [Bacteroidales bacterium]|nr:FAD:protein FMN transferase [Bacteroidales bacterium]